MSGEQPRFIRVELDGDDIVGEMERQQLHELRRGEDPEGHDSSCACCCIACTWGEDGSP